MREFSRYRTEAKLNLPTGYYILTGTFELQAADMVWSWTTRTWHRADDSGWLFSPLIYSEDIVCAARKIEISEFEKSIPAKRSYTIR